MCAPPSYSPIEVFPFFLNTATCLPVSPGIVFCAVCFNAPFMGWAENIVRLNKPSWSWRAERRLNRLIAPSQEHENCLCAPTSHLKMICSAMFWILIHLEMDCGKSYLISNQLRITCLHELTLIPQKFRCSSSSRYQMPIYEECPCQLDMTWPTQLISATVRRAPECNQKENFLRSSKLFH